MSKAVKIVSIAVGVVVVLAVVFALIPKNKTSHDNSNSANSSQPSSNPSSSTAKAAATITYDGNKFSPAETTVKAGDTVKVTNTSSTEVNFDSDPHPVHTDEPELNAGAIAPGQSKSFKVTKKGDWGFHNHLNPSQTGRLKVE